MGAGGWSQGGVSIATPARVFDNTPVKNYQDLDAWFEELCSALGADLEIWNQRFVSAQARANLLDPTYVPVEVPGDTLATATQAALGAPNADSMLDVLAFVALAQYPLPPNLTIAQKQAMVQVGAELLSRKGNRLKLLKLVAAMTDGVVYGWTLPPYQFSFLVPDGQPDAGFGPWVPTTIAGIGTVSTTLGSPAVTGSGSSFSATWIGSKVRIAAKTYWIAAVADATHLTLSANATATVSSATFGIIPSAQRRPWLFEAIRTVTAVAFPGFVAQGIGYSQFRAGYAAAGEPVLPLGARLCILNDEHFSSWSGGALTAWTVVGTGPCAESQVDAFINHEFTNSCAMVDLTGAGQGVSTALSQIVKINNQRTHRLQFDYAYTNSQQVASLRAWVRDVTNNQYYNPATQTWGAVTFIGLPPSDGVPTRIRFAIDILPQAASNSASIRGTAQLEIGIIANSDDTETTQQPYHLYRAGLYEKFDEADDALFDGDPIGDWPLVDALGYTTLTRSSATLLEPANYNRSALQVVSGANRATFDYHPALTGRAFRSSSAWTNLLKGTIDLQSDWTPTATTVTTASALSPVLGETVATATVLTGNTSAGPVYASPTTSQTTGVTPTSRSYVCGIWARNLSPFAGTFTLSLGSTTTHSQSFAMTPAQGWTLLPMAPVTFAGTDTTALTFTASFSAAGATAAVAVALYGAHLYEVTGRTGMRYPPVSVSPIGATSSAPATVLAIDSATPGSDVLHPLVRRTMASVANGALEFTAVPMFDAGSQPATVLFDCGYGLGRNRITIDTVGGALRLVRFDDSSTQRATIALTLTTSTAPVANACTWQRDTALVIRARWFGDGSCSLSCGSSSVLWAADGTTYSDTSVAHIAVGCTITSTNSFDGLISGIRSSLVGSPTT